MTSTKTEKLHLSPTDEEILDEINEYGRATVSLLSRCTRKSEQHVRDRVRRLVEHGVLIQVAPHLYDRPTHAEEYLPDDELDSE